MKVFMNAHGVMFAPFLGLDNTMQLAPEDATRQMWQGAAFVLRGQGDTSHTVSRIVLK